MHAHSHQITAGHVEHQIIITSAAKKVKIKDKTERSSVVKTLEEYVGIENIILEFF